MDSLNDSFSVTPASKYCVQMTWMEWERTQCKTIIVSRFSHRHFLHCSVENISNSYPYSIMLLRNVRNVRLFLVNAAWNFKLSTSMHFTDAYCALSLSFGIDSITQSSSMHKHKYIKHTNVNKMCFKALLDKSDGSNCMWGDGVKKSHSKILTHHFVT